MKKIILLVVASLILLSCGKKVEKPVEKEDDFLKVPKYETPVQESQTYTPIYKTNSSSATPTYWYVTFEEVKRDANGKWDGSIDWHRAIKLETPYFDFIEARKALPPEATGECYFDFIVQINKEGYESYQRYRVEYFKD
jgi:hypothetical protein